MKLYKFLIGAVLCLALAGCGSANKEESSLNGGKTTEGPVELQNTPSATETPAPTNTSTPTPTNTPTPTPTRVPEEDNYYLFSYFIGEGVNEESIYYAVSSDGYRWTNINNGQPVLTSTMGTTGVRDPFLLRSEDGETFYLIATDLCINKSGDWGKAQDEGSTSIMIWESNDLVYWSEQRMVEVGVEGAGCVWAPEAYYDKTTGEYIVFWSSRVKDGGAYNHRVYYATTKDFVKFSKAQIWIDDELEFYQACSTYGDFTKGRYPARRMDHNRIQVA